MISLSEVGEQDLLETLATVLIAGWKFRQFSESRWLTVGTSCRVLVLAQLQGMDSFYEHLRQDSGWGDGGDREGVLR